MYLFVFHEILWQNPRKLIKQKLNLRSKNNGTSEYSMLVLRKNNFSNLKHLKMYAENRAIRIIFCQVGLWLDISFSIVYNSFISCPFDMIKIKRNFDFPPYLPSLVVDNNNA